MKRLLTALALVFTVALPCFADVLVLADSTRVEGKLVEVTKETARIRVGRSVKSFERAKVAEIFRGERKIENPCPFCRITGKVECVLCRGAKKAPGHCTKCKGEPHTTCKKCKGTKKAQCKACKGRGKRTIVVQVGLRLRKKVVDCGACKGYGWKYCGKCKKKGYLDCKKCRGKGTGPCPTCEATGFVACPCCRGTGEKKDDRSFLSLSFRDIQAFLDDRKKSDEAKDAFFENLLGKHVFWTAVVVDTKQQDNILTARLNLDPANGIEKKGDKPWKIREPAPDLTAFFRPSQLGAFLFLEKGSRIRIAGVLFTDEEEELTLLKCELIAEADDHGGK
ncbi:MAG: hypothetical protein ACYS47_19965 [Planctomycetota bacterium]|jgi:hypothetical protein